MIYNQIEYIKNLKKQTKIYNKVKLNIYEWNKVYKTNYLTGVDFCVGTLLSSTATISFGKTFRTSTKLGIAVWENGFVEQKN